MNLVDLVIRSARQSPAKVAVKGPDGVLTYGALDSQANHWARGLFQLGVRRGDRVGIWLEKATYTIAAMQGILRLGAIYVPLDPLSPPSRINTILHDCAIQVLVTTKSRATSLCTTADLPPLTYLCLDDPGETFNWQSLQRLQDEHVELTPTGEYDTVYILYTSGSTGKPKGVCISNRNALAFVEWAAAELDVMAFDHLANHAPFHFDLSVFDLYAAFLRGATVCLVPDGSSYDPRNLVGFLVREAITLWYSVPSVLILMMEQGDLFNVENHCLRAVLFAGEPFPIKHLHRLYERWPGLRLLNLYGPTETNVCTFYEVMEMQPDQTRSIPIGRACSGDTTWVQKEDGLLAGPGVEGELIVAGPTVMVGYWGQPPLNGRPYATGDLVRLKEDGNYVYLGRRDRMVKIRGHRIELGDIEAALEAHTQLHEVAVVTTGSGVEARLVAFIVSTAAQALTLLEIKRYCAERLPRYMIVDRLHVLSELPRTRNGKVDRLLLTQLAQER